MSDLNEKIVRQEETITKLLQAQEDTNNKIDDLTNALSILQDVLSASVGNNKYDIGNPYSGDETLELYKEDITNDLYDSNYDENDKALGDDELHRKFRNFALSKKEKYLTDEQRKLLSD